MNTRHALAPAVVVLLTACSAPIPEPVASDENALRLSCGPVYFTGTGESPSQVKALSAAEEDARKTCETTPSYCWVDCENAPIAQKGCGIVNHLHSIDPYWSCEVTIAASTSHVGWK